MLGHTYRKSVAEEGGMNTGRTWEGAGMQPEVQTRTPTKAGFHDLRTAPRTTLAELLYEHKGGRGLRARDVPSRSGRRLMTECPAEQSHIPAFTSVLSPEVQPLHSASYYNSSPIRLLCYRTPDGQIRPVASCGQTTRQTPARRRPRRSDAPNQPDSPSLSL